VGRRAREGEKAGGDAYHRAKLLRRLLDGGRRRSSGALCGTESSRGGGTRALWFARQGVAAAALMGSRGTGQRLK
jgi:hypothetical protein